MNNSNGSIELTIHVRIISPCVNFHYVRDIGQKLFKFEKITMCTT